MALTLDGTAGITANPGTITVTSGTVTTSTPIQNDTQTWNASGVTFTGWKVNITDTASASGSLLADLQVGGSSKFSVRKDGAATAASISFGGSTLSTYTESSYTGTVTGFSTAITKTIYYTKVGNLVVVDTQEIGATSNATTKTITGAPAAIQPSTANKRFVGNVSDNGGTYVPGMVIFNGGTFTIYPNLTGGNWTASGTAIIEDFHISFTLA